MKQNQIIVAVVALAIVAGGLVFFFGDKPVALSRELDGFAQCLKDKGATFYGAFWCPHCQAQKKLFGGSVDKLPYVECSTPDGQGQTEECKNRGIQSYPTWVFADHSTSTGEVPLKMLADKSGCELPATAASNDTGVTPSAASPAASSTAQ